MTASTRKALTYVELDITYCANTYGVAPCTASIPTTGSTKCFNTLFSCQDSAHFIDSPKTLRFAIDSGYNPADIEALPVLESVSISPARISLGEDLGQRESVTLTFIDQPHADTGAGFDKYVAERSYNPYDYGTLWGKFRARHPYMVGRPLRLYRGFLGDALADMEIRHYEVEFTSGPGIDGRFTITAKDPLKILDGDRAQAPRLSSGSLSAGISSGATSATLTPSGIGNSEYPASGYIAIGGKEIMAFTRSGDSLTLSGRGSYNTTAQAHSGGDRVQVCLVYTAADPANIINDLMTTYGAVDSALIPLTEWQAETAAHNRQLYTTLIAEPVSVRALIGELIVQAGLAIWSDVVTQTIRLQVLRQIPTDVATYDKTVILPNSLTIEEQPDKRISEVWTLFAQRNPLEGLEDPSNYRSVRIKSDTTAEAKYGAPAIKKIYSRWIPFGGSSIADRLNNIQLGRFVDPPRAVGFSLLRTASEAIEAGGGYKLAVDPLQAFDGSQLPLSFQVTRIRSEAAQYVVEGEEVRWVSYDSADLSNRSIAIDASSNNINLKEIHDSIYPAAVSGDQVTFIINKNVVIGSTSQGSPAIDTGTWPTVSKTGNRTSGSPTISSIASTAGLVAGMVVTGTGIPRGTKILSVAANSITLDANATSGIGTSTTLTIYTVRITVQLRGKAKGAGGKGGKGADASGPTNAANGQQGGTALKVRSGIDLLLYTTTDLYGGGGGGGGAGCQTYADHRGGGGGGGAGYPAAGAGGSGPGSAESGSVGTSSAGGGGGRSFTNWTGLIVEPPELEDSVRGGTGGGPGLAGDDGTPSFMPVTRGLGGAAGMAIDGWSLVDLTDAGADIRGPQSN